MQDLEFPEADSAETGCLGSVFLDNETMPDIVSIIGPEDFFNPNNRRVFSAMCKLYERSELIDPILVGEVMKKEGSLESYGGVARLLDLIRGVPLHLDVKDLARLIKKASVSRQAIRIFATGTRDILAGDLEVSEILGRIENRVLKFNNELAGESSTDPSGFVPASSLVETLRTQFENYNAGIATGVKSGMERLDNNLDGGGFQRKGVYLVAGAEKSGKTSLALDWIEDIVTVQALTALIVTLEMSKETLLKRLYAKHTGIPYYMFRPGFYDGNGDKPYSRALEGLAKFGEYPFLITDNLFDMESIERHCSRAIEQGHKAGNTEVGIIFLDYLQLIVSTARQFNSREAEVSWVSRRIKRMAADLDVPVVVMSNMNRTNLNQDGSEPDTYNLRDSQQLAFDAEAVMFVHDPAYTPGKPYQRPEIADMLLLLSRQRNGPTDRIPLKFIGPYMQFMTEDQYAVYSGGDVPETKGQRLDKQKKQEDLWDEDDEEWSNG